MWFFAEFVGILSMTLHNDVIIDLSRVSRILESIESTMESNESSRESEIR